MLDKYRVPKAEKVHKQHKMYIDNANQMLAYPTRPIFHLLTLGHVLDILTRVGSIDSGLGGHIGSARVGIGNAKVSRWVYCLTRQPNASDFCVAVEYRLHKTLISLEDPWVDNKL